MRKVVTALLLTLPLAAGAFEAKVVGIADGDTMTVLRDREQIRVRLARIDAPEKKQAFGERARQSLAALCFGRMAEVTPEKTDRYGRTVARVICQGEDVDQHQVRTGMAWVYRQYSKDGALLELEAQARAGRRGLWSDKEPVPPWEWRRAKKHNPQH
jgi:endonuclease YncB( thermonuclease family)